MPVALLQGRCRPPSGGRAPAGDEFVFWEVLFHVAWEQCTAPRGGGSRGPYYTPAFWPGTAAWVHSAPGQHQTLDAFARHQHVGSESLAKGVIEPLG